MIKIVAFITIFGLMFQPSLALASSIDDWTSEMIAKLGFHNGKLDRSAFGKRTQEFISRQTQYYRIIHNPFVEDKAHPKRADEAHRRLQLFVERTATYAHEAESNIFKVLANGEEVVTADKAEDALKTLGQFADIDQDGRLDVWEAQIAEAALVRGTDITAPGAWKTLARMIALDSVRY